MENHGFLTFEARVFNIVYIAKCGHIKASKCDWSYPRKLVNNLPYALKVTVM